MYDFALFASSGDVNIIKESDLSLFVSIPTHLAAKCPKPTPNAVWACGGIVNQYYTIPKRDIV